MKKINCLIIFSFFLIVEVTLAYENLASFIIRDYDSTDLPIVGNLDADITIVEFFDYRCGYCSKQAVDLTKLLQEKENIRIVYLEFPIFGGISETAAKIALIVWRNNPNLYFNVHNGLMALGSSMKKDNIIKLLNQLNLDGNLIYSEAEKDNDNEIISRNRTLAKSLNIRGTPAIIINDNLSPGYLKLETLKTIIQ